MSGQNPPTDKGQERRKALLVYAQQRFAEVGYHPTSVADIVDGVGVGKGVFYWYFDSKEAMLREILRDALGNLQTVQNQAVTESSSPLEKLQQIIGASVDWLADNPAILRIVQFGWTEETFASAMRKGRAIMVSATAEVVQEAIDANQIRPGPTMMMATAIHGVIDELARSYHRDHTQDRQDLHDCAIRFCLTGLVGQETISSSASGISS